MLESEVKTTLVRLVKAQGGYGRRIEDQYGVGILDTILIIPGYPVFFAEAKIIRGVTFGPSPRQYIEMLEINDCVNVSYEEHAIAVLIGWKNGHHYFHKAAKEVHVNNCLVQGLGEDPVNTLKRWFNSHER